MRAKRRHHFFDAVRQLLHKCLRGHRLRSYRHRQQTDACDVRGDQLALYERRINGRAEPRRREDGARPSADKLLDAAEPGLFDPPVRADCPAAAPDFRPVQYRPGSARHGDGVCPMRCAEFLRLRLARAVLFFDQWRRQRKTESGSRAGGRRGGQDRPCPAARGDRRDGNTRVLVRQRFGRLYSRHYRGKLFSVRQMEDAKAADRLVVLRNKE